MHKFKEKNDGRVFKFLLSSEFEEVFFTCLSYLQHRLLTKKNNKDENKYEDF